MNEPFDHGDDPEVQEDFRHNRVAYLIAGIIVVVLLLVFGYMLYRSIHNQSAIEDLQKQSQVNAEAAKANSSALNKANRRLQAKGEPTVVAKTVPGAQGVQGAPGPQGPPGPRGSTGATGPAGKNGTNGKDGNDGEDGAPGPQGAAGSPGARGPKGDTGKSGANGTDGQSGSDGSNGKDGATGAKGDTGPAGDPGAVGPQGPKGDTGPAGKDGTNGKDGAPGKDGKDGTDGKNGRGIADVTCNADGTWTIEYSDGTDETVDGPCRTDATPPSSPSPPTESASSDPAVLRRGDS